VLLQVALYCGIPASLQAHHAALEVLGASSGNPGGQSGE
jgi:alkylhydroperoxidase/carboxymuconolactone decarboxylase family protein YurZ